jgi:DNA-binding transcriptional LysR family regulator
MASTDPIPTRHLEVFVALVDHGSFTRAARFLGLSQSTVSGHMADFERRLGLTLVTRERSGATATAAGEVLLGPARAALRAERSVRMAAAELTGLIKGSLTVGGSTIPADFILPALLGRFRQRHPGIAVDIRAGDTQEIVDLVARGDAELGVVGGRPSARGVETHPVGGDHLVLIVPEGHAFAGRPKVGLEEVVAEPHVGREQGSGTWRAVLDAVRESGVGGELDVACRVGSTSAVKASVRAGLGLAFVSQLAVEDEVAAGTLGVVPVEGFDVSRRFHVVSRKVDDMSPAGRAFLELVQEAGA